MALLASHPSGRNSTREDRARLAAAAARARSDGGEVKGARYHGVDEQGRPYTLTAATARQVGPDHVDLTDPIGDMTLKYGSWLMLQSHNGVFRSTTSQLDLSGDVTLYRDDGTTMDTQRRAWI